jgi:hypothetical protein
VPGAGVRCERNGQLFTPAALGFAHF